MYKVPIHYYYYYTVYSVFLIYIYIYILLNPNILTQGQTTILVNHFICTLPNKSTVQAPVHLGVFSHDVTRMVYSPRPSSSKYIYIFHGGCVGEGGWDVKERAKEERPIAETTIFSTFLFLHYRTGPPIS